MLLVTLGVYDQTFFQHNKYSINIIWIYSHIFGGMGSNPSKVNPPSTKVSLSTLFMSNYIQNYYVNFYDVDLV